MKNKVKQSLAQRVCNDLEKKIRHGELDPGQKIPSIRQIALDYDVATVTAAQAIKTLCKDGWVKTLVGDGTYVLEQELLPEFELPADVSSEDSEEAVNVVGINNLNAPVDNKSSAEKSVYFFFDGMGQSQMKANFYMRMICGMQREVTRLGVKLIISDFSDHNVMSSMLSNTSDVLGVLHILEPQQRINPIFNQNNIHVVVFGIDDKDNSVNFVVLDNYRSGWNTALYLHNKGHENFAFVDSYSNRNVFVNRHFEARLRGIRDYCTHENLDEPLVLPWDIYKEKTKRNMYEFFKDIIKEGAIKETAMIVGSHMMVDEIVGFAKEKFDIDSLFDYISVTTFEDGKVGVTQDVTTQVPCPEEVGIEMVSLLERINHSVIPNCSRRVEVGMFLEEGNSVKDLRVQYEELVDEPVL